MQANNLRLLQWHFFPSDVEATSSRSASIYSVGSALHMRKKYALPRSKPRL